MLVLDEYEPYGAAVLDAERFRYFVVSPLSTAHGEEEITANGFREIDVHPSEPYPRGGTDFEAASRRTEAHVHRFYKDLGELTRDVTLREGVQRLILAGPRERIAEFRRTLPNELHDRVVAEEHVDLGAPEGELLARLEAVRERGTRARKGAPGRDKGERRSRPRRDRRGEDENTDTLRNEFGGIAGLTRF